MTEHQLNIAVLTSRAAGIELAAELQHLPELGSLTIVTTSLAPGRSWPRKLRTILRHQGVPGLWAALRNRVRRPSGANQKASLAALIAERCPSARHLHCHDLHAPASLARLRELAPDLGVVFATYKLRPEVFRIPRLGCVNLHLGRAPEFRGSSPGFYEMLEGVPQVGVTIHRVSEQLDGGAILLQEVFPIDLAPPGDPVDYLQQYQSQVLVPNGMRLMAQAVRQIARGTQVETPQQPGRPPRRRATYVQQQELRRRVALRRIRPPSPASPHTIDIPTS
jgi:folate-dependent phosphoribosylglycinamide formyltransferase PurN